jgi:hypothetical protein
VINIARIGRTFFVSLGSAVVVLAFASGMYDATGTDTGPTFASFLTPAGAIVAAGIVTALIEVIKGAMPAIGDKVSGALMAFFLTAILYVLTAIAVGLPSPDAALNVFLSWLTAATSAIGIKSATAHVAAVRAGTAGAPPAGKETGGTP